MTTLEQESEAYAKAHPHTPDGTSWENGCARLMWDFCASFTKGWATHGSVATARAAMQNSELFFPVSAVDILPGRFVWLALGADDHVGIVVSGSGLDALVFWASDALTVTLGNHIGFGTVRNYIAKKKSKLLGVSEDYAGAIPNLSAFEDVTPPTPVAMEAHMQMISVKNSATFDVICENGYHFPLTHPQASVFAFVTGPGAVVTAADRTTILSIADSIYAANRPGTVGTTDLTPVLTAIANLSTLETADEKAIVAQLSALPDQVRKNIVTALGS